MGDATQQLLDLFDGAVRANTGGFHVDDPGRLQGPGMDRLVRVAVFGAADERDAARRVIWDLGQAVGVRPASIAGIYFARARGECGGFTVPAINVRMMAYDTARAVFRAAKARKAGAIILEIARSEIAYTDQRPAEYVSVILAAAMREGYLLPVFIQGDHCQVNQKKFTANPKGELGEVKKLIGEELAAGFYNIDVDTSTLVDLSHDTLDAQQRLNYEHAAEITAFIRAHEPGGISTSVGAEIGEVGHKNSTVDELHAFMQGYARALAARGEELEGISKISVQTGTSHGGVVLPDGSIADVKLDLDALEALSRVAREEYGLAGAVQHGASTLPPDAFGNFPRVEAAEIHLATNFQNIIFDHPKLPADLLKRMLTWLDGNMAGERKDGDSDEQFYYKTRKKAIGPFKEEVWSLAEDVRAGIAADLEQTFGFLFEQLNVGGTASLVNRFIHAPVQPHASLKPALAIAADDADAGE